MTSSEMLHSSKGVTESEKITQNLCSHVSRFGVEWSESSGISKNFENQGNKKRFQFSLKPLSKVRGS